MGTYGSLTAVGPVLDALGDPTRRAILDTLRRSGPSSVSGLAERVPVSRPAISQHLKVLGRAGLVDHEPQGTRNIYRVDRTGLDELRSRLDEFWGEALDAFADHIRTETRGTEEPPAAGGRRTEELEAGG
ncbi:MAG TPA: metalloregulator ArsR/SmtB family transcription factor [Kribbella sp.]|uniref:ArsR/SmtB family transcription factor n=1 Tax=Kribbella sp. TaxID=1871183 RepID=UPI002D797242|nr:metalloregulator ArsR/SmtB family transcription factor [Kribbella sp.]HET6296303.1 metalloregulator ArsR/SmtB family transcription factor [Kribbella sp.]